MKIVKMLRNGTSKYALAQFYLKSVIEAMQVASSFSSKFSKATSVSGKIFWLHI
jgi:hypothetical protein